MQRFEYIEKGDFQLAPGLAGIIREKQEAYSKTYGQNMAIGVVLFILCSLPLITAGIFGASERVYAFLTALLLVILSIGLFFLITTSTINGSFQKLLREGEFAPRSRKTKEYPALLVSTGRLSLLFIWVGVFIQAIGPSLGWFGLLLDCFLVPFLPYFGLLNPKRVVSHLQDCCFC